MNHSSVLGCTYPVCHFVSISKLSFSVATNVDSRSFIPNSNKSFCLSHTESVLFFRIFCFLPFCKTLFTRLISILVTHLLGVQNSFRLVKDVYFYCHLFNFLLNNECKNRNFRYINSATLMKWDENTTLSSVSVCVLTYLHRPEILLKWRFLSGPQTVKNSLRN